MQIASKRKLHSIELSLYDSPMHGKPSLRDSRPSAVVNTSTSKDNELRMGYLNEEFESFLDIRLPQLTRPSANTAERRADQPSYESENDQNSQSELKKRGQLVSSASDVDYRLSCERTLPVPPMQASAPVIRGRRPRQDQITPEKSSFLEFFIALPSSSMIAFLSLPSMKGCLRAST